MPISHSYLEGFSCEQPVHEPSDRCGFAFRIGQLAFIEAVRERSRETKSRFILDAEIIARRTIAVLLPPFHGDAFGPLTRTTACVTRRQVN